MPSFKKLLLTSIPLSLITVLLSGCTLITKLQNSQNVTLKFWGLWESPTTVNQIIEDYKKVKPNVTVVYEKRDKDRYRETVQSFIDQNKGPDIYVFHNTWTPMLKNYLAAAPSSVISSKELQDQFYPINNYDLKNGSNIIGLPQGIDGLALYLNEDIFASAGVDMNFPVTWQNIAVNASKLTVKDASGNIKTAGIALGTSSNVDSFSDILATMMMQNGADPKNPIDKQSADALDYYVSFAKSSNKVWDENLPHSTTAFVGGNLAMYIAPSWRAIEIQNANPLLKFKVVPFPQLEGGKITWASYWANGVSSKSTHQKEAWEFVKYLSDEQTLIKLFSESSKSPGRFFGEAYPRVSMASKLLTDPVLNAYISDAPTMRSAPLASYTYDNGLNDELIKIYDDIVTRVLHGDQATSVFQTSAKNIADILTKYGLK